MSFRGSETEPGRASSRPHNMHPEDEGMCGLISQFSVHVFEIPLLHLQLTLRVVTVLMQW